MFDSLNRFGLPVKYAIIAFLGGVAWAVLASLGVVSLAAGLVPTLIALTAGGYLGGMIRQRMG